MYRGREPRASLYYYVLLLLLLFSSRLYARNRFGSAIAVTAENTLLYNSSVSQPFGISTPHYYELFFFFAKRTEKEKSFRLSRAVLLITAINHLTNRNRITNYN